MNGQRRPVKRWSRVQPTSLRDAMDLCREYARDRHNKSVDHIADDCGISDKFRLYSMISTGKLPANLIRAYENSCGVDFVTRWLAGSAGKLLVDMPTGRRLRSVDVAELHAGFGAALQLLTTVYEGKADVAETMEALTAHLEAVAWHRENVGKQREPELDFGG